ncbi:MAG TPA: hypothetical protein VFU47_04415 [Armatimonadota bacterium]|nr:hypothetical protein [Armatimonadota bacterium]
MAEHYPNRWTIGPWTIYEMVDHGFGGENEGKPLYGFTVTAEEEHDGRGRPRVGEWYPSLEYAMVAAVAEKHTGRRGAGGTGVGTAADWFMRMIGAGQLQRAEKGREALTQALAAAGVQGNWRTTITVENALEASGHTIARHAL